MQTLEQQLVELELFIPFMEKENFDVSKVSVAWQIDHSLRVVNGIIEVLEDSDPNLFQQRANLWRFLFLTLNFLPRGKGKSPKRVMPDYHISESDLKRRLGFAFENILSSKKIPKKAHFRHPMFGTLIREQSSHFIQIHTEHHLKIIRDILKP